MAYLVRIALCVLSLFFAGAAFAYPASGQYSASLSRIGITATGGSASGACAGLGSSIILRGCSSTGNVSPVGTFVAPSTCNLQTDAAAIAGNCNWADTGVVSSVGPYSCGPNSTLSGSQCVCASGFTDTGDSCTKVVSNQSNCSDAAAAGSAAFGQQPIFTQLPSGFTLCIANEANSPGVGCTVELLDPAAVIMGGGTRYVRGFPRRTNTGSDTCPLPSAPTPTPTTEQEVKDAPKACPGGQQASMNGVVVCQPYPAGSTVTTPTKSSTSTTSGTGVDGNSPTSSSASGATQCVGAQCTTTTTTTTTKADGTTSTTTSSTTQSKAGFCAENPASPQCDDGSFSGACGSPPVCSGDAVQCAVAAFTLETKCALTVQPKDDAQIKLFNDSIADQERTRGDDGSQTDIITSHNVLSSTDFDRTELLGAPVDLPDQTYQIQDLTFVIPWSKLNAPLKVLGLIGQAVVFLLCARIVLRG